MTRRNAFGIPLDLPVEHSGACPDCDATTQMVEEAVGLYVLKILHDSTCPQLRRMERP